MIPSTLKGHDTGGFLGVNLRKDRLRLEDGDVARAINVDFHTQPGTLIMRKGRANQLTTALADLEVRRIGLMLFSLPYYVAGHSLYRATTAINGSLSTELVTTFQPFRPLNDDTLWMFVADQGIMLKDDGSDGDGAVSWGSAAPTATPVVAAGAAGSLTGEYSIRYTYARLTSSGAVAYETNPSPVSNSVTLSSQVLSLSGLTASTDPQITHLRVYRTVAGATAYLFDQNIANGTTTGTSSQADTALGDEVETDNDPPPEASWVFEFLEHLFLCRDASNPHYLWWSKRFRPEAVPLENFLEVGNPSDPLQCGVSYAGLAAVFTRQTKYRLFGNATSGFNVQEAITRRGTTAINAVKATEHGVIYPSRDGIFQTMLASPDVELTNDIEPLFMGETVNDFAPINWDQAVKFSADVFKGRYYFSYCSGTNTSPDMLAVFSFDTKRWYFYDHPLSSLHSDEKNNRLIGGNTSGQVVELETGSDDDGERIAFDCETKEFAGEEGPHVYKFYQFFKADLDTGGDPINIDFFLDDTRRATLYVTTTTRSIKYFPLPEALLGFRWRARFRYTGRVRIKIYGCAALYVPLGAA
jgi:hypothetical protein